jgi:hypothetical protein
MPRFYGALAALPTALTMQSRRRTLPGRGRERGQVIPELRIAEQSYVLFRPALKGLRADPRFIQIAHRIGLTNYWRKSGKWPDFCSEPGLPYNCQAEAAKYAG